MTITADWGIRPASAADVEAVAELRALVLPVPTAADTLGEGGRGLVIVAAVTDRWGVTPYADGRGKTVWFECVGKAATRRTT
ncbi:hypothetical protein [Streptomyces parvulus]|uniref:hypothetical protein n=1 Tax=Streptomyces parvulus TaxID=146923 RepID=UPI003682B80F